MERHPWNEWEHDRQRHRPATKYDRGHRAGTKTPAPTGKARPRRFWRQRPWPGHSLIAMLPMAPLRKRPVNVGCDALRLAVDHGLRADLCQPDRGRRWRPPSQVPHRNGGQGRVLRGATRDYGAHVNGPNRVPCVSDRCRMAETRLRGSGGAKSAARRATPRLSLRHSWRRTLPPSHTMARPEPKEQPVQEVLEHDDALPHLGHSASHTSTR